MENFGSRVFSVNDYREWAASGQLVLSPQFQRRVVWTDTARSYLMDTIIRGKPIPKIFLRQRIDLASGQSIREVVDGQQRLRTILAYVSDGLVIRRSHNQDYGGLYFSQLPEAVQLSILSYELSTDLLINVSDSEVLDIFGRLNSHAVVLNEQERINASHFGDFKRLADDLAHRNYAYWVANRIVREASIMRMQDVSLAADLLIAMCDGIQSKKQIRQYYALYEDEFPFDAHLLSDRFQATLASIDSLYPEGVRESEFRRVHLYYSLFTALYHMQFGLPHVPSPDVELDAVSHPAMRFRLEAVESIFDPDRTDSLTREESQFLNDSRRATTDAAVRERRTKFLVQLASGELDR